MRIIRAKNYEDMSRKAANIISAQIILEPNCVLGLATGSSPLGVYKQLIEWYKKGDVSFSNVTSINLDEYFGLAPDDPQSYRYFMDSNFFSHIDIKPQSTYLPNGMEEDPDRESARYEAIIASCGGIDLQLLGLGHNGHIGFNEPGTAFEKDTHKVKLTKSTIDANKRFFNNPDKVPRYAYTLGIRSIMQARRILIIVSGSHKAKIVHDAFYGPVTPELPASVLQLHNNVTLVGDNDALAMI
jgi:glucosamine-6-phosphate deaminase